MLEKYECLHAPSSKSLTVARPCPDHRLSEEPRFKDKVQFVKFDVDDLSEVAQQLHVRAMPTFVAFRDGDRDGEVVGADPSRLTELVKKLTEA